ncbi:Tetratricopeptide repeat-containing protein [Thermodesulfobacterium geofontis OPF15]|uniref:Tetratricopeptide repeat-containing protein n=1 Tax=Thermodesulfobacterium geofontis (strain OPF15) TaxID=795359 RepID=F8C2H9_THEGP|nr:tetratricopeptide repeat protein [Thermodesulfobacterium geofontis]AEH22270.1 Tetratricopeptide repeat-containing protein [Thermodesulfobacterium geofontis OPF15]
MDLSEKLLSFHEKLARFFEKYLRAILALIIILLLITFLWIGFSYYKSKKEKEASLKLMEVVKAENIISALQEVKEKYKGTQASLQASLLLLDYYYTQKNYQEMQKLIEELQKEYPKKMRGVILYGKAKTLEINGDFNRALEIYKEVSKVQPELNFLTYLDIARIAENLGKFDLAKEYYQKYLKESKIKNSGFVEYKLYELSKK